MLLIKTSVLDGAKYKGLALPPFIFVSKKHLTDALINHELIHLRQAKELCYIGWYILYPLFSIIYYIIHLDVELAYKNNPFEVEAYANEKNKDYLKTRRRFEWITKFLKSKKT